MAKWNFQGVKEYVAKLEKLSNQSEKVIKEAVYEGAGLVADAVRANIEGLPISDKYGTPTYKVIGVTETQKQGLRDGFGISRFQNDSGYVHVKLGFDGYNGEETEYWGERGQPNSLIARSVNSGTSFRQKIPFVDNATRQMKKACEEKMKIVIDQRIFDWGQTNI